MAKEVLEIKVNVRNVRKWSSEERQGIRGELIDHLSTLLNGKDLKVEVKFVMRP